MLSFQQAQQQPGGTPFQTQDMYNRYNNLQGQMGLTGQNTGLNFGGSTGLNGVPVNSIGGATGTGQGFNGGFGGGVGGGIGYNTLDTLTPQQHQIANLLQKNIQAGTSGGNPADSLSPDATAQYNQMAVAAPMLRQFDQSIMPRLNDAYASVGALMGSRRGFSAQQALEGLQTTVGSELGKAQLSNQQLSANLNQQRQLGFNQMGVDLTGQSHMAIQPYRLGLGFGGQGLGGGDGSSFVNTIPSAPGQFGSSINVNQGSYTPPTQSYSQTYNNAASSWQ